MSFIIAHVTYTLPEFCLKNSSQGAKEMLNAFEHLFLLQRTQVQFLSPTWYLTTTITPIPGDHVLSSDFQGYQGHAWCTCIHAAKTLMHIK